MICKKCGKPVVRAVRIPDLEEAPKWVHHNGGFNRRYRCDGKAWDIGTPVALLASPDVEGVIVEGVIEDLLKLQEALA